MLRRNGKVHWSWWHGKLTRRHQDIKTFVCFQCWPRYSSCKCQDTAHLKVWSGELVHGYKQMVASTAQWQHTSSSDTFLRSIAPSISCSSLSAWCVLLISVGQSIHKICFRSCVAQFSWHYVYYLTTGSVVGETGARESRDPSATLTVKTLAAQSRSLQYHNNNENFNNLFMPTNCTCHLHATQ